MPKKTRAKPTPAPAKEALQICAVRIPASWLPRLDRLAAAHAEQSHAPVTRSTAIRMAIGSALDLFETIPIGDPES